MLTSLFDSYLNDEPITFHPPPWVSIVAVIALSLTLLLAVLIYLGIWLALIATLSVLIAFVLWLRVGYTEPISRRALPGHILLIIALLAHGAEQRAGGYANTIATAFPDLIQPPNIITDASIALSLSLSATVIWLVGGAMTFYHARAGGFIILLCAVWSIVFSLSHFVTLLLSGSAQGWIPGMATGPIVTVIAVLFLRFIATNSSRRRLS